MGHTLSLQTSVVRQEVQASKVVVRLTLVTATAAFMVSNLMKKLKFEIGPYYSLLILMFQLSLLFRLFLLLALFPL